MSPNHAEFDTIEAEIDTIKADVRCMRREAKGKQKPGEPCAMRQQGGPSIRAAASKIPAPASSRSTTMKTNDLPKTDTCVDMTASPGKGPAASSITSRSYAGIGTKRTSGPVATTLSPASEISNASFATCTTASYHDAVEYPQENLDSEKPNPHFAQPTQAATRRMDETLRKDTTPAKSSPDTTPGKATKARAPDFKTDKRAAQRGQKRTSLPEGWMSNSEHANPAEKNVQKKEQLTPGSGKPATSADQSPVGSNLKKKTSSYMSPTKSAQNRSIATIGEDRQTRKTPRVKAGALRINTKIASKDALVVSSSPLQRDDGSDEVSISPRSQFSSMTSKKETSSPLKTSTPSAADQRSPVIRLPLPLPHVANTTVTHRDPDEDLLDPIKEKLEREDLLRRDSTQESPSPSVNRSSRGNALAPVFARLNRATMGAWLSSIHRSSEEETRASVRPRPKDPDNEPILRLLSGLKGQSSAEIGKALAGGQQKDSSAACGDLAKTKRFANQNPGMIYQGRKRSGDPAILYQGRKPSVCDSMPQDPAIIFNSGPLHLGVSSNTADQRKVSQPSSLRATATDFVPTIASDPSAQAGSSMRGPEGPGDTWWPPPLSLFHDDSPDDSGTGSLRDIGFLPERPRDGLHETWHGPRTVSSYGEPFLVSDLGPCVPGPHVTLSRHFDLIHGDHTFDTPTASPTSDEISPSLPVQARQRNPARWEITGRGRRHYHWTGGDGLEISFKGLGPDAEHDPNSPVLYHNYRANTKTLHRQAASYPRTQGSGSPLPPDAPKLMRDYAERMGLSRIPCNNDQWSGKYDCEYPAIVPVAGLCEPCKEGDNVVRGLGGGIDLVA